MEGGGGRAMGYDDQQRERERAWMRCENDDDDDDNDDDDDHSTSLVIKPGFHFCMLVLGTTAGAAPYERLHTYARMCVCGLVLLLGGKRGRS